MYVRVPSDPENPTFRDTFRVPIWTWVLYAPDKRHEWTNRRRAARNYQGRHRIR